MNNEHQNDYRYFLTYSGIKLPLKLVTPLSENETENRNTYFRACFDESDRLIRCEKIVYGEIEFEHQYEYYENGVLKQAKINDLDDDPKLIQFNEAGDSKVIQ